jgi:DNA-binding transcriptional MerR regulator
MGRRRDHPGGRAPRRPADGGGEHRPRPRCAGSAALEQIARQDAPLRIGQLANLLGVRTSALRFWERSGLVRPVRERTTGYRRFDVAAARDAHLVRLLREGNFSMTIIRAALDEMHSSSDGRPERVGAELSRRDAELHTRSLARLRADATLVAYLDWRESHPNSLSTTPPAEKTT